MSVTVRVPTTLRTLTGGESTVTVDGATLADVLDALEGSHPIPAFCVSPKMSPLGALRSRSSVRGSAPFGPAALVRRS